MFETILDLKSEPNGGFEAPAAPDKGLRTYGGQFLAQSLYAGALTLEGDWFVHSLHAYFLRPGDVDATARLDVDRVRDGRTFSSRQVMIHQHGKELFRAMLSLQKPEETLRYSAGVMPDVPPPEKVTTTYDEVHLALSQDDEWHGSDRPMDILYVNPPGERGTPITEPQLTWIRIRGTLPDSPIAHQAAIAYLSDSSLVDHIMLPHGLRWQDEGFAGASLDHAMWFYRPARADEWLLFEQWVEATGSGRGLGKGRFYTRDGALVASCAQEGLMRWSHNAPPMPSPKPSPGA